MKMMSAVFLLSAAMLTPLAAGQASAAELITNGGFETGTFAGWTVAVQPGSGGTVYVDTPATNTPASDFPTAANSVGGNFYAVIDQNGIGANALYQTFNVTSGTTALNLSFQMFINNYAEEIAIGSQGLDYTGDANQHVRVDILKAGADPLSTSADDVIANLFIGGSISSGPNPYITYNYDLQPLIGAGSYQLRFGEVDNLFFQNVGIDNVSINAATAMGAVPEPACWALMIVGFGAVGGAMRRRKNKVIRAVGHA